MSLRHEDRTRVQQIGDELTDGLVHLRSAAAIAAERAAETVAPKVDSAYGRVAPHVDTARDLLSPRVDAARQAANRSWSTTMEAIAPVVTAAADGARRATEEARRKAAPKKRRRWPWVVGIVAAGVTAGAVAAVISRRRAPRWEEYEPEHQFAGDTEGAVGLTGGPDATASVTRESHGPDGAERPARTADTLTDRAPENADTDADTARHNGTRHNS